MSRQVDFYLISNQVSNARFKLASRLCNKIQRMDKRTLVMTENPSDTDILDKVLWSFSDTSFVAHDQIGQASDSSIQIGDRSLLESSQGCGGCDVLINLAADIPDANQTFMEEIERVAEIVEQDEAAKASARLRFKAYKELGYELKTHQIEL